MNSTQKSSLSRELNYCGEQGATHSTASSGGMVVMTGTTKPRRRNRQRDSELEKMRARRIAALLNEARRLLGVPDATRDEALQAIALFIEHTMKEVDALMMELSLLQQQ